MPNLHLSPRSDVIAAATVHVQPGDTLVLTVNHDTPRRELDRLAGLLHACFPKSRALVLNTGMDLRVYTAGDAATRGGDQ